MGLVILFGLAVVGAYLYTYWKARPSFYAHAEYWVYIRGEQAPDRQALLSRLMATNPYARGGRNPLGTAEGQLTTDVRFHMAVVLRSRNAHVFRPDLMDRHANIDAEKLARLSESHAFVKLRYVSERPLFDRRHLQFLLHAADAVVDLCDGVLVFDSVLGRLWLTEELKAALAERMDQTTPDRHVDALWESEASGGRARSRGLVKVGRPEIVTEPIEADERLLALDVVRAAAASAWDADEPAEPWVVHAFDDDFRIETVHRTVTERRVRIYRVQPA